MARTAGSRITSKIGLIPTVILVVAVLYFARDVLIPLTVAILLAFLLTPAVKWLERRGMPRSLASVLVMVMALAVLVSITWALEHQFVDVVAQLPHYRQNIQNKLRRFEGVFQSRISKASAEVEATLKDAATTAPAAPAQGGAAAFDESTGQSWTAAPGTADNPLVVKQYSEPWIVPQIVGQYSGLIFSPLTTAGLVLVFAAFILFNRTDLRDRILLLVGDARMNVTTQALDEASTRITKYLQMQSAINFCYGVCVGLGLWTIGRFSHEGQFPNALLWAFLAVVLRFLPYLGPWIAAALPLVLSLVLFKSLGVFVATASLYVGLEIVTGNFVEPWLYGSSTGMSAVAILASAVFWTWLWGPIGLLLATPLSVCLVVLGKYVPHLHFLAVMLGDDQALEPSVLLYQRLLALDHEEATELLLHYRKTNGLEDLYEQVMIPALMMAEKDRYSGMLDADQERFVWQSMRELLDESAEAQKKETPVPAQPVESPVAVLCLPANSQADEIVGLMLAQLLEFRGQRTVVAPQGSLASEMLDLIETHKSPVVCISATPPAALAHSRYLCKRLYLRFPDLPAVIGLWTSKIEPKTAVERLACDQVRPVITLAAAIAQIHELMQSLVLQRAQQNTAASPISTGAAR